MKACSDANIYLHYDPNEPTKENYEIHIGEMSNSQTSILKDGEKQASVSHSAVLDCNSYQEFWISWLGHDIVIGQGSIFGEQVMTNWKDDAALYEIIAVTLASSASTEAQWKVHRNLGTHHHSLH